MRGLCLYQKLEPGLVLIDPPVQNREELFAAFAELFARAGAVADPGEVVAHLEERERILSTGIGRGVAVPHTQIEGLGRVLVAASTHPSGLSEYPSLDGEPIRLAFCLLGDATTAAPHLAGLARIARLARRSDELGPLIHAATGEEFLAALKRLEGEG